MLPQSSSFDEKFWRKDAGLSPKPMKKPAAQKPGTT
jgi:hypothetical protein